VTKSTVILILCFVALTASAAETMTPEALLQRGMASYRAGRFSDAATDLDAVAKVLLSQDQMQAYVDTGKFPAIDKLETALVYLALAQSKLGHDDQAREAVQRLLTAQRIENRYAQLSLGSDASQFEALTARLMPGASLAVPASPVPIVAQAPPLNPTPAPLPAPPPLQAAPAPSAPPAQSATVSQSERDRAIDETIKREVARIQKEADDRIAAERAAIQREADARVAAAQREAEAHVAAIQAQNRRSYITTLRQGDDYAANHQLDRANEIYNAIATAPDAPREIVAEAGVGLYRTGAYANAAAIFAKLVPFVRGEEDLRYYDAVSLFETGKFVEAKKVLVCALPYLEVTDDITRYRTKIEQASAR
jgi:hypothetical protein